MRVSALNWQWKMANRPKEPTISEILQAAKEGRTRDFNIKFPNGLSIEGVNTDDDVRRVKELVEHWKENIEDIGPIPQELQPLRPQHPVQPSAPKVPKPFTKTVLPYIVERSKDNHNSPKTIADKKATFAAFAEQFGDPDMSSIDKAMAVAFKTHHIATAAGAGRVNTKIGHLSDFFDWCIGNGHADSNPFEGTRIGKKAKLMQQTESFEPFTGAELASIFSPATYPVYAGKNKPHYHWLPFLLLYTGARPNELAGLSLDDVRQEAGVDYFNITAAKNSNSQRKVPLHKTILASGFMAYVAQRRQEDPSGQLFPALLPGKNGHAKNVSRRFNESYLAQLKITDPTHRLYSFRSTFITRMTELNVNTAMLMAIVGHHEQSAVDLSSPHFKAYQGAKLISALRDVVNVFDVVLPMAF
jgi:integrase